MDRCTVVDCTIVALYYVSDFTRTLFKLHGNTAGDGCRTSRIGEVDMRLECKPKRR